MRPLTVPLLAVLLVAGTTVAAQTGAASGADVSKRVAELEAEVIQLRGELVRLRVQSGSGAPHWSEMHGGSPKPLGSVSQWRPYGPGRMPPTSPLQAQWAWAQPPLAGLVAPFGAADVYCVPCPACADYVDTLPR